MNKKGQLGVGLIVVVAIAIIVGIILFQAVASNVDQGTRANSGVVTVVNGTYTGVLNTPVELAGQELVSLTSVGNATTGANVAAANYTVAECVRTSDNLKGICYTAVGVGSPAATGPVKISYTYYPNGYIDDAGARSIAGIIVLLTALGIALIAYLGVKSKLD
jgi:predicted Kef-type K+ transport protein